MLKLLVFSKNVAEQKIRISLGFSNSSNNAAEQVWFWIPKIFFKNELYYNCWFLSCLELWWLLDLNICENIPPPRFSSLVSNTLLLEVEPLQPGKYKNVLQSINSLKLKLSEMFLTKKNQTWRASGVSCSGSRL